MTAPNVSPWDDTVPHRPGASDFDGCVLTNDPDDPPIAGEMPTAEQQNTLGLAITSMGKVVANCVISVIGGTSPTVAYCSPAPNGFDPANITVTRSSIGNLNLTWPAGSFPTPASQPLDLALNEVLGGGHTYAISAINITNGVRVMTMRDGALADLSFTVGVP